EPRHPHPRVDQGDPKATGAAPAAGLPSRTDRGRRGRPRRRAVRKDTGLVPPSPRRACKRIGGLPMANDPSDTGHLLERLRGGARQALTDLFQRRRDRLRRMVDLRMDARLQGRVDASDVLQDAFLDAATYLDTYLKGTDLPPFLWLRCVVSQRLAVYHPP